MVGFLGQMSSSSVDSVKILQLFRPLSVLQISFKILFNKLCVCSLFNVVTVWDSRKSVSYAPSLYLWSVAIIEVVNHTHYFQAVLSALCILLRVYTAPYDGIAL